jgi:ribosomal protein L17
MHKGAIPGKEAKKNFWGTIVPRMISTPGEYINTSFLKYREGDGAPIYIIEFNGK